MELKEIKARFGTKCKKCNRELKIGWTVYFNPKNKDMYCKYCGKELVEADKVTDVISDNIAKAIQPTGYEIVEQILTYETLHDDLLAKMDKNIRDLSKDLVALDNFIRNSTSKSTAKKKS